MKDYSTVSDIGCFSFGTKEVTFKLPNLYGDGLNRVHVFDNWGEFEEYKFNNGLEDKLCFGLVIEGKFVLYDDDCSQEGIVAEFDGKYVLYLRERNNGSTLYMVKK